MNLLQADDLCVHRGGRPVVDGVSLSLQAGEWLAIVGPNGAGKSSLLAALAGLLPLQRGQVRLQGRPLADWPARERAQRSAWLAQVAEADGDIPVRDVVRLGRLPRHGLLGALDAADEAAVQAALQATDTAALAGRRLSALSGGERQRVLLARALAVQAPVLLLDEPTAHLDMPHQALLLRHVRDTAAAGGAVAAVLHDLTLALQADRVLVMDRGRVVAQGRPGDAALHGALEQVFGGSLRILPVDAGGWAVLPRIA